MDTHPDKIQECKRYTRYLLEKLAPILPRVGKHTYELVDVTVPEGFNLVQAFNNYAKDRNNCNISKY